MQVPSSIKPILDATHCYAVMPVVWGEMDALGHVNNVVYFRYLETARVEFCRRAGLIPESGHGTARAESLSCILHSVRCRFRKALFAPDQIWVTCEVRQIDTDRITLAHSVLSRHFAEHGENPLAAEGEGVLVCFDYVTRSKAPLPAAVLKRIESMKAESARGQAQSYADRQAL